ncbi:MAG: NADH-quinone oxidoreductase subunit J [Vicinamibacterales bacterium]
MDVLAFYIFAAIAVVASLLVVGQRNPMYSVMLLITSFGALAGLYVLLDSPFTAVTQIIIYAGAIMVLFLFVVMLLNVPREESVPSPIAALVGPTGRRVGAVLALVFGIEVVWALSRVGLSWFSQDPAAESVSSVARIGAALFRDHVFAFEATSILILVAMVGAVVIARREH